MSTNQPIQIDGWKIYAHPLFLNELETLTLKVEKLQRKYPDTYQKKKATKLLAAIVKLAFEEIPQDPAQSKYRQGKTLGDDYKHWFRAKFYQRCDPAPPAGARERASRQQYRLFFRYHQKSKIIVYAWVNDEQSKRAYGSKTDAYSVFQKMLNDGNPPDSWEELLKQAKKETKRLDTTVEGIKE